MCLYVTNQQRSHVSLDSDQEPSLPSDLKVCGRCSSSRRRGSRRLTRLLETVNFQVQRTTLMPTDLWTALGPEGEHLGPAGVRLLGLLTLWLPSHGSWSVWGVSGQYCAILDAVTQAILGNCRLGFFNDRADLLRFRLLSPIPALLSENRGGRCSGVFL